MKSILTTGRRKAQWVWTSRAGFVQPWALVNSVPKSGTHLAKAILKGAGFRFAGHVGESELGLLSQSEAPNRIFATAHVIRPITGPGIRLLVFRDPADVALSMAVYIRGRADHPRRALLSGMSLGAAVELIFAGTGDLEPLAKRFQQMHDWAVASNARAIDFAAFKRAPQSLLDAVDAGSADLEAIAREIGRWNPTKRSGPVDDELEIKHALRQSDIRQVKAAFDVYEKIQSLT